MPLVHLDDIDLHYDSYGEGPPFVFISGTATHGDVWKLYQVPEFSRTHRVIVFDQRGTGATVTRSTDVSTGRIAADVAALLDHLGLRQAIVLGHSMGGRIAQSLALDHPDKVGKLVLASTGAAFKSRGIPVEMCLALVEKGYERYVREHSIKIGFTEAFYAAHKAEIDKFLSVRLGNPPTLEMFLRYVISRQEHDTSQRLKDIRVPTLVLAGSEEGGGHATGLSHMESSQMLAREIPGAKFAVIPGHRHYYPFADPKTTNAIIRDFLGEP
jgi:pimeloyl-ACP methyl ester carboxylesterase